jgi:hypothetical protein
MPTPSFQPFAAHARAANSSTMTPEGSQSRPSARCRYRNSSPVSTASNPAAHASLAQRMNDSIQSPNGMSGRGFQI